MTEDPTFPGQGILLGLKSRRVLVGVLALCAAVAGAAYATMRAPPVRSAPLEARLELAAGEVTVDEGAGSERAYSGSALHAGARVAASEGARALLRLSDGSAVFLRGGAKLSLSDGSVKLDAGEVWIDAPPTERKPPVHRLGDVEVSAVDAGLSLKVEGGTSKVAATIAATIYVARGLAVVTSPAGRVEVSAGEQASVAAGKAPAVAPVAYWSDWTGGMGDHPAQGALAGAGAGTLYGVDIGAGAGSPARPLETSRQSVRAVVRSGFAETEVDQTFFNPGDRAVEGWYWFTVPEGASITSFALETNGALIEGELIERREAQAQYGRAVQQGNDPALLEWIDGRTYRARIYPVPNGGTRRVVVRYLEQLPMVGGRIRYVYPMQTRRPVRVGEFSLAVDLGDAGRGMSITTLADARIEDEGRRVTMRRSGYTPRADFQLEGTPKKQGRPVTVSRFQAGNDAADYLMMRYLPDVDWGSFQAQPGAVVVVVDTSAAGDDASRQLKSAAAEAIVRALSADDRFALVSLDVKATALHPAEGLAPATGEEIAKALERLAEYPPGGATDLSALFDVALARLHGAEQPAVVYVGDGIATSGDTSAEQLVERLRRALSTSRARLFTVGVGSDANHGLLAELARAGGGQSYPVEAPEQASERALRLVAGLKAPTITDLEIDFGAGLDEVFVTANGKVSRGDEVILLARTHHDLPTAVRVQGRIAGKAFDRLHEVDVDASVGAALVPRLWAAEHIRRTLGAADDPESVRGKVTSVGIEYGLMTPYTSFLALDSESAYLQQGIPRRSSHLRGVRLTELSPIGEESAARMAAGLAAAATGLGCGYAADAPAQEAPASDGNMRMKKSRADTGVVGDAAPASPASVEAKLALPSESPPPLAEPAMKQQAFDDGEFSSATQGGSMASASSPVVANMAGAKSKKGERAQADVANPGRAGDKLVKDRELTEKPAQPREARLAVVAPRACSDISERPLAERAVLWRQRLKTARGPHELVGRYEAARSVCELADWRAEALFIRLLERHVKTEGDAALVLGHFGATPDAARYLGRLILRRAADERLVAAVQRSLFGEAVDWRMLDVELSAIADVDQRLDRLRAAAARAKPDDPAAIVRLVRLLALAKRGDEALLHGRRLVDLGLMTPSMARELGDILADQGQVDAAVRAYSEIVEFDADSTASRRMLGDIYLAHGWYQPAYSQYQAVTEHEPKNALAWLRLASAAAGAGRVDEALRIERSVAEAEGTPGPDDPRRVARLLSAARLARLLAAPPAVAAGESGKELADSVTRKLKELQLFRGPGRLVLLTWEDLSADLALSTSKDGVDATIGESSDAATAGLAGMLLGADADSVALEARVRSVAPSRAIKLMRHDIRFDGKGFKVEVKAVELPAEESALQL